ncbi:MAG: Gfo/Idh/MocA family oxidoreductase [Actinomycetota bacterium]|nr:Gfo/Idh/MocA family oxidoreductase [Actinomycetota bacterium]
MKWALIGASDIASTRVIPALRLAGQEVLGVMSSNAERAEHYAASHDLLGHSDQLDELLSWPIDAVYISTTNELHASQAIAAAASGKHILCEKPLSIDLAQGAQMVAQAKAHGVVLGTNHHIRASGVHEKIREIVGGGELGDIYLARVNHAVGLSERLRGWRLSGEAQGAGVVWDIVVHNVDTLRADLRSDVVEVTALSATGELARSGIEDLTNCTFRFANGVIATTCESYLVPFSRTSLEIHGSLGSLVAMDVMRQDPIGDITITNATGRHDVVVDDRENLYVKTIRRFEQACYGIGEPFSTGADGLAAATCATGVLISARERRTVALSELTSA